MKDYYRYSVEELKRRARLPLTVVPAAADVYAANNAKNRPSVIITPVGPLGQYPIFVARANAERLDLRHTWFVNMDEYVVAGRWIAGDSSWSFHRFMQANLYDRLDPALAPPVTQRVFPDPQDPAASDRLLAKLGHADLVIGGIGLSGHIAFNEPQPGLSVAAFAALPTRVVDLTPATRIASAIGDTHGALALVPTQAVTLGMRELLAADRIVLGCFRDWHRGVVRQAVGAAPTAAFPVTLVQTHPNAELIVPEAVAAFEAVE
ncbi:glucosamine-6-phosphate isomerase [Lacticaseibacillus parakribbianus]|uniref:glucosamine-6-phosphate isomerase n=1 Tax=Lacticaseibacillus parakribbianus TaxID=2970927 RepID=UPI0021CB188B|nr:glucosamine-6-phosphate isomerase [Lacticaseibacillus parakribbianus]